MDKLLIEKIKDLEKQIGHNLRKVNPKPNKFKNMTQVQLMGYLIKNRDKDINQKDICEKLNLKKSSVSEILDYFEREDIINRVHDDIDKRKNKIVLSKQSLDKVAEFNYSLDHMNSLLIEGLNEKELEIFNKVLDKMSKNMEGIK